MSTGSSYEPLSKEAFTGAPLVRLEKLFVVNDPLDEALGMCVSESETHRSKDAPLLFNTAKPETVHTRQKELPKQRVALELAAKGYTAAEIGRMIGYHPATVSDLLRQDHVVQTLVNRIREVQGEDDEVVEFIKSNVVKAVETLAEVMVNPKAKGSERIAAAEALLNRRYGKPNQPVNRNTDIDLNKMSDADLAAMLPTERTATNA